MPKLTLDEAKEKLFQKIVATGAKGATKSKLGVKPSSLNAEALEALEAQRRIGNLGDKRSSLYVAIEHFKPLEIAYGKIMANATTATPKLFAKSRLFEGIKGAAKRKCDEALALLVAEKALVKLKYGSGTLYLLTATLKTWMPDDDVEVELIDAEALRKAYVRLVEKDGFSDVLIYDLQQQASVSLEALKEYLIEACKAGKAAASGGDWSLSSDGEREAAISINDQPHLRIRLLR